MRGNPIYLSLVWLTDLNGKVFQVCLFALFFPSCIASLFPLSSLVAGTLNTFPLSCSLKMCVCTCMCPEHEVLVAFLPFALWFKLSLKFSGCRRPVRALTVLEWKLGVSLASFCWKSRSYTRSLILQPVKRGRGRWREGDRYRDITI